MSDRVLEKMNDQNINRFWSKNFGEKEYVDWERYKDVCEVVFNSDYVWISLTGLSLSKMFNLQQHPQGK